MNARLYTGLLLAGLLVLTGCVSREEADAKLARGCAAGAELFIDDGMKIKEIKNKTYKDSEELGPGYREVTLTAVESDGWYDGDQEYKCIFEETRGPMGMTYSAAIYQLKMHDKTWGKEGDKIVGSMDDHLKLTEKVDQAMN